MRTAVGASLVASVVAALSGAGAPAEAADGRLMEALRSRDHAAMRVLIERGADPSAAEGDGATPLHWAVRWDDAEAVGLLLDAGADVDAANDYGVTPLSLACACAGTFTTTSAASATPRTRSTSGWTASAWRRSWPAAA